MYSRIFFLLMLPALLAGCKSKSAFNYSQDIVALERSLEPDIEATESKVKRYYENSEYDSIALAGSGMEKKVQEKIDKLNAMPLPDAKGASEFKSATLRYFDYIKNVYSSYKKWGSAATDPERESALEKIMDLINGKDKVLQEMQKAQRKYADANGFRLENK